MQQMPDHVHDPAERRQRRRMAPPIGIVVGALLGLLIALVVDLVESDMTPIGYLGGALVGAVVGLVLALLIPAELDDGDDDAHAAAFEHGDRRGRADAPIDGAGAHDRR